VTTSEKEMNLKLADLEKAISMPRNQGILNGATSWVLLPNHPNI
jgi:hypothetical protein